MTSKLTKEWLQHQISAIEAVGITDSNTLAAFKLALAAMDDSYDITASQLREAVHYNPDTGRFTRRSNGTPMEHLCGSGYYCLNLFKRSRLAHRMAYYYMTGRLLKKSITLMAIG